MKVVKKGLQCSLTYFFNAKLAACTNSSLAPPPPLPLFKQTHLAQRDIHLGSTCDPCQTHSRLCVPARQWSESWSRGRTNGVGSLARQDAARR